MEPRDRGRVSSSPFHPAAPVRISPDTLPDRAWRDCALPASTGRSLHPWLPSADQRRLPRPPVRCPPVRHAEPPIVGFADFPISPRATPAPRCLLLRSVRDVRACRANTVGGFLMFASVSSIASALALRLECKPQFAVSSAGVFQIRCPCCRAANPGAVAGVHQRVRLGDPALPRPAPRSPSFAFCALLEQFCNQHIWR